MVTAGMEVKDTPWKESYGKPRQCTKKQRHHFVDKGPYSQDMAFPVVMYRGDSWTIKKAECQRIDGFELWCWIRLWRVPWTTKPNQSILNQPWIFTGRTDAEWRTEALILRPRDAKSQLTEKDPHARKDWRQEEKGMAEDELVGWHHRLNGDEFE